MILTLVNSCVLNVILDDVILNGSCVTRSGKRRLDLAFSGHQRFG